MATSQPRRRSAPTTHPADQAMAPSRSLRVAVIGAGAAGLVAARELRGEGHDPVVFERAAGVGGTWIYDAAGAAAASCSDPLGVGTAHSSMYTSLRTNLPREVMGFLDFPFAAGPDSADPRRYPSHREVLLYLDAFARRFGLHGLVRLNTEVVAVTRIEDPAPTAAMWRVRSRRTVVGASAGRDDTPAAEDEDEVFDAVVVCNGHYSEPRVADVPGVDAWPGKQMHSHRYRVPDPFQDQVVVIIGAGNSGGDISRDIAGVAKEVHMACWSAPAATCQRLPGYRNLWLRSMVERAEEDGSVVFRDGGSVVADAIVHCTGYKFSFPFLGDDSTITVDDNRVHPLYKHVFPPQLAPHLSFIGLPIKVIPFPMFQLQSSWVAGVLSGRVPLPPESEMMDDVRASYSEMEAAGWPRRHSHCLMPGQFEYDDWVAEQCGHGRVEEWRRQMFDVAFKKKRDCPETYREEWEDHHLQEQASQDFQRYL